MSISDFQLPEFASVSDLQRNYAKLLKRLKEKSKSIIVLRKNKLEAVIVEPKYYEELIKKARQHEEEQALEAIQAYRREKKKKKLSRLERADDLFAK